MTGGLLLYGGRRRRRPALGAAASLAWWTTTRRPRVPRVSLRQRAPRSRRGRLRRPPAGPAQQAPTDRLPGFKRGSGAPSLQDVDRPVTQEPHCPPSRGTWNTRGRSSIVPGLAGRSGRRPPGLASVLLSHRGSWTRRPHVTRNPDPRRIAAGIATDSAHAYSSSVNSDLGELGRNRQSM